MDLSPGRRKLPLRFLAGCTVTAGNDVAEFGKGVPAASCSPHENFLRSSARGSDNCRLPLPSESIAQAQAVARTSGCSKVFGSPCLSLECLANLPLRTRGSDVCFAG